jgi:hypothetical protein
VPQLMSLLDGFSNYALLHHKFYITCVGLLECYNALMIVDDVLFNYVHKNALFDMLF